MGATVNAFGNFSIEGFKTREEMIKFANLVNGEDNSGIKISYEEFQQFGIEISNKYRDQFASPWFIDVENMTLHFGDFLYEKCYWFEEALFYIIKKFFIPNQVKVSGEFTGIVDFSYTKKISISSSQSINITIEEHGQGISPKSTKHRFAFGTSETDDDKPSTKRKAQVIEIDEDVKEPEIKSRKLGREDVREIRAEMEQFMTGLQEKYNFTFNFQSVTWNADSISFKIETTQRQFSNGEVVPTNKTSWNKNCERYGLRPEHFGKTFVSEGVTHELYDINTSKKKYSIITQSSKGLFGWAPIDVRYRLGI